MMSHNDLPFKLATLNRRWLGKRNDRVETPCKQELTLTRFGGE